MLWRKTTKRLWNEVMWNIYTFMKEGAVYTHQLSSDSETGAPQVFECKRCQE
jgi:hypothetical protein